jgi:hypothetical protein
MRKMQISFLILSAVLSLSQTSQAEERREGGRYAEPRSKGVPQHGTFHHIAPQPGKMVRVQVLSDHRSHVEIRRDPHIVAFNHVGWHPVGHWNHWYRDWGVFWRLNDWSAVQTVTCEAVDTQTELLYPVTETRGGYWVWSADLVNNVAARSLDECAAESGHPESCVLVERECWNSIY